MLLDALGTLVELSAPAPRLRRLLEREGFAVDDARAAAGFRAEIAYYLDHHLEGRDAGSLDDLRDRCAEVMREALQLPGLDHTTARRAMLGSLEFVAFADVAGALTALRKRGHTLVVVSNWDCSLPGWLSGAGVLDLVDAVVSSAEVGAAKPDPAPFLRGLELAGAEPADAIHIGDSPVNDLEGARAAGVRGVLVDRAGAAPAGTPVVRSLGELASLL